MINTTVSVNYLSQLLGAITEGDVLPGVMEETDRTTAAGNVSIIAMLMQWTRSPTSSLNEPWEEREKQRGTEGGLVSNGVASHFQPPSQQTEKHAFSLLSNAF